MPMRFNSSGSLRRERRTKNSVLIVPAFCCCHIEQCTARILAYNKGRKNLHENWSVKVDLSKKYTLGTKMEQMATKAGMGQGARGLSYQGHFQELSNRFSSLPLPTPPRALVTGAILAMEEQCWAWVGRGLEDLSPWNHANSASQTERDTDQLFYQECTVETKQWLRKSKLKSTGYKMIMKWQGWIREYNHSLVFSPLPNPKDNSMINSPERQIFNSGSQTPKILALERT